MTGVWYCPTCGYEVDKGGRCHNCRQPLIESPLAELAEDEIDDEVGYRIVDWDDSQRGELIEALIDDEIRHRFEGDELVVAAEDEAAVDALVAQLTGGLEARAAPEVTEDPSGEVDEATVEALEALHHAARRLRSDPTDMVADGELAEAGARIFALDRVYGIDGDSWASIGRVTRRLLGALGADVALDDEIASQAAVLCRLLEPIVAPQAGDATPWTVTTSPIGRTSSYQPPAMVETEVAGDEDDEPEPAAGDRHEVVYDLSDWLPEERAQLGILLDRDGIAHTWEASDLVVSDDDWDRVDVLCAEINPPAEEPDEVDDSEDDGYHALSELFGAADRLAGDPEDKAKRQALVDAAAVLMGGPVPFGMADAQWWQIRNRVRALTDSLDVGAGPDVVQDSAATLSDLLRGFV